MHEIIYIKYGELFLKGKNRNIFIKALLASIKNVLIKYKKVKIITLHDGMLIDNFNKKDKDNVIQNIKQVPGIKWVILAITIKQDYKTLCSSLYKSLKKYENQPLSFKVITNRIDKSFSFDSLTVSRNVGGILLDKFTKWHVDIHNPALKIYIEIKHKEIVFYHERYEGMGGFPLGINGRVLLLISGGIDSPVAAKLLIKKGIHVDFITFITPPHTKPQALKKVKELINIISLNKKLYTPKLFICNFTRLQHEISHIYLSSYQITIMRRYFLRISSDLAKSYHYNAIATGESLGQVASQTIQSLHTIEQSINNSLVLRPLLCFDKDQIIELAKKFGTYQTSILQFSDCCSLFVPPNPVTKPNNWQAQKLEQSLDLINKIYELTLKNNIKIEE